MTTERTRQLARVRQRRQRERNRAGVRRHQVRDLQLEETTTRYAPLERPAITLNIPGPKHGLKIAVLPDVQVRSGVPIAHLSAYGQYLAEKRPDVIVCIGDFADMPSLSGYNAPGSLEMEGLRYKNDVRAVRAAMSAFLAPIRAIKGYNPVKILTYGNHEDRILRTVASTPRQLEGLMTLDDLGYEAAGWKTYPFLQPVIVGGIAFCHYFPSGVLGRPVTSAKELLRKMHMSCFAGHLQGRDIAFSKRADGTSMTAIISGSYYLHDETYLSPFTNKHWRGAYVLHEVKDGSYDEMALSIGYLMRRFS